MDNQHRKIEGYCDFNQDKINLINEIKFKGAEVGGLIKRLEAMEDVEQSDLQEGTKRIKEGFMWTIRAVAKPTTFV